LAVSSGRGSDRWLVPAGNHVDLATLDPGSTSGAPGGRADTEAALPALHEELADLQDRLWAEARQSLLVVLQGMDAAGKDGTISHVFRGVNPQGTRVASFKQPTTLELAHDFLWRVHQATPRAGELAIFNRSHYEDVLITRVHGLVPEATWKARYALINSFEALLADGGTTVVKLFLHISKGEQRKRFDARLSQPTKRWKFQPADLAERERWDDYQLAYADAIGATATDDARWYVIPANHKWYRNWAVSCVLIDTLTRIDPHYPEPSV
jgi:PPK2 family polyphosphate:nucleotide phosphotransferase